MQGPSISIVLGPTARRWGAVDHPPTAAAAAVVMLLQAATKVQHAFVRGEDIDLSAFPDVDTKRLHIKYNEVQKPNKSIPCLRTPHLLGCNLSLKC